MTILNITEARKRLYGLVDDVAETHEPVQITGKHNTAYLVSREDWNAIQETLYLMSVPGMTESIRAAMVAEDDAFVSADSVDWDV